MLGLFRWATVAVLLGLPVPSALQAQYPRARRGQFEVAGLDFRPDGGWRTRVASVRVRRHRWLRQGAFGALNLVSPTAPGDGKVTGRVIIPVLPIAFRNVPPPFPIARYQDLIFSAVPGDRPYSLRTFYEQLSNGNITVDGRVLDWITADSADTYYEDGCNGIGVLAPCPQRPVSRFGELLLRTLDAVSQDPGGRTVWSDFDNDGPDGVPNSGDDDGVVDFVTFLQPERDGACPNSSHIWAHRFVIRAWNGGSPYVTRTPWAGHPGQFLKVDSYTMQSAVGGNSACEAASPMPIGTLAHETGHAFGLPDLYDTDLGNPQVTQGIGEWGLMGSGNYARPYSPARYEAWSLFELGWVTVDTLSAGREVNLGPVVTSDTVLYLPVPGTDEYYLLENRQPLESDSAQMNPAFGSRQKAPGLLVWHIDQGQLDQHGFGVDNRANSGPLHAVALVQADGRNDLRQPGGTNRGDTGDPFPGASGNTALCRTTTPAASDNQGGFAWFCLEAVSSIAGGRISFRYVAYHSVVQADHPGARISVNGSLMDRLDRFFAPGTVTEISIDSLQANRIGRTRYHFLDWSDGGSRTHVITAHSSPDSVTARVAVDHRLRMTVQGAANTAVVSDLNADVAGGVFLAEGSHVSLRAQPQASAVFARWSGDTTSTSDVMSLTMQHPVDLIANFVGFKEVVITQAANAVLGVAQLSQDEAAYLDAAGNRNGLYDLGDFLAELERSGSSAPAQLSRGGSR
ncbi:MAG: M6 family metalloprotease domain-containing protein [Gemmatimonadales bacterium]